MTYVNVRDENYKETFLFPVKEFFHLEKIFSQCILCQSDS